MSDVLRLTGMFSGMQTEEIISQMVSAKAAGVTKLKEEKTKLEWKQTLWQDLNKKVYGLYSKTLSNMRFESAFAKKKTTCSDTTKATIVAGDSAVNGSQTLSVNKLAKTGYLTGGKLVADQTTGTAYTDTSKLKDIIESQGGTLAEGTQIRIQVGSETAVNINVDEDTTVSQFVLQLQNAGVNASFDEKNQRFFISAKATGEANDFSLTQVQTAMQTQEDENSDEIEGEVEGNPTSTSALQGLGLSEGLVAGYSRIDAQDAEIVINGATFTSDSNTFQVNGLTVTATGVTEEELTINTETDYDGIYDMVKNFLTEYNEVINDVYGKYNAASARKYNMLTEEEKEAMTESEVETWENTIKNSLLRKDKDVYTLMNTMMNAMNEGYAVNGSSKKTYLFDFGIERLHYFNAEEDERLSYHINGDEDDEATAEKEDELRSAIASDPEGTMQFFTNLCKGLYDSIHSIMERSEYRSIYKVYDDKKMENELDDYDVQITAAQKKVEEYEDKWYDKFTAMEVALSKLQSNANAITNMLG